MIGRHYLDDVRRRLEQQKALAEKALAQISDDDFFSVLDQEANSVALLVKHLNGNMRSRWTDFLATDGEKPDRDRDREFIREAGDTRERLMAAWEEGWRVTFATIDALQPEDLQRVVTIRGEPHTVVQALNRHLVHCAYHVGQILLLAKHHAGSSWTSLSIPRGRSREYQRLR